MHSNNLHSIEELLAAALSGSWDSTALEAVDKILAEIDTSLVHQDP